jgi:hypothetical protein
LIERSSSLRLTAAALAAAAAAACLPAAAGASSRTTQPQKIYKSTVVLTNAGISFKPTKVLRGCIMIFSLRNSTRVTRSFFIGGYLVHRLKPGAVRHFNVQFLFRGKYPYYSAGFPGKRLRGSLEVT